MLHVIGKFLDDISKIKEQYNDIFDVYDNFIGDTVPGGANDFSDRYFQAYYKASYLLINGSFE